MDKIARKVWVVNLMLVAVLLLLWVFQTVCAEGAERYTVQVFLVEANGVCFAKTEEKIISDMRDLVAAKADLQVTEIAFEGKLTRLNFSDLPKSGKKSVTVALFPAQAEIASISYFAGGGVFVAATPREAYKLLKKYL